MEFNIKKIELTTQLSIGSKEDISPLFDRNLASSYQLDGGQAMTFNIKNSKAIHIITEEAPVLRIEEYNDDTIINSITITNNKTINSIELNDKTKSIKIINLEDCTICIAEVIMEE